MLKSGEPIGQIRLEDAFHHVRRALEQDEHAHLKKAWRAQPNLELGLGFLKVQINDHALLAMQDALEHSIATGKEIPFYGIVKLNHVLDVIIGKPHKQGTVWFSSKHRDFKLAQVLAKRCGGNVLFGHTHPDTSGPIFSSGITSKTPQEQPLGADHAVAAWQNELGISPFHIILAPDTRKPKKLMLGIWMATEKGCTVHEWKIKHAIQ